MLRDVLLARTPEALLPGAPYAILSIIGGVLVVLVDEVGTSDEWLWWLPVAVVVLLRFATLQLGWETPAAARVEAQVGSIVPTPTIPSNVRLPGLRPRHRNRKGHDGDN
jgi:hypothetical protein